MGKVKLLCDELPQPAFEGKGGAYYAWTNTFFPALAENKIGCGKFVLQPRGFALPHFADCSKIGYVIAGTCGMAGIVHPNTSEEVVVKLEKGDAITVSSKTVSWWFNAGDDELQIIFLGETLNALQPGQFTYSFLTGALGVLKGFSTKSVSKAYNLDEEQANKLTNIQTGTLIIKVDSIRDMPMPSNNVEENVGNLWFNFNEALPEVDVPNGGSYTSFKVKEVELTGNVLKLYPNAMFGPLFYAANLGVQLIYVVKGSGRVEAVGMDGKVALDDKIEVGQLFVVPKSYVIVISASGEGIECFSIVTTSEPVLGQLSGNKSIFSALSPKVLQASFNVDSKFGAFFMKNLDNTSIILPP